MSQTLVIPNGERTIANLSNARGQIYTPVCSNIYQVIPITKDLETPREPWEEPLLSRDSTKQVHQDKVSWGGTISRLEVPSGPHIRGVSG